MLNLFSVPKPWHGHNGLIQTNALKSWLRLGATVAILGDEDGVEDGVNAANAHAEHYRWSGRAFRLPGLKTNEHGTPLVSSAFELGQSWTLPGFPVGYINADIVLLPSFRHAIAQAMAASPYYFVVSQRWDVRVDQAIAFDAGWADRLLHKAKTEGELHQPAGIDVFVFPSRTMSGIPDFALGRFRWDNFLIWRAKDLRLTVIDVTDFDAVVHQDHDYAHTREGTKHDAYRGEEALLNERLARRAGCDRWLTTANATIRLTRNPLQA